MTIHRRWQTRKRTYVWLLLLSPLLFAGCADTETASPNPATGSQAAASDEVAERTADSNSGDLDINDPHGGAETSPAGDHDDKPDDAKLDESKPDDEKPNDDGKPPALFEGWPKPDLAVVFTGMLEGYIEPCGCTGLENQKGGLSRRHTMIRQLQDKGWPVTCLDLGGLVRRFGPQSAIKYQRAVEAHRQLGYQVIGLSDRDLKLTFEDIMAALPPNEPSPFVSANVRSELGDDFGLSSRYRVVETAGVRLGVTQVLGSEQGEGLRNKDFEFLPPADALPEVMKQLKAENCDLLILLASTSMEEARELVQQFKDFDFVVVASDSDPPAQEAEPIEGTTTRLIDVSHKGMFAGVLGIYGSDRQSQRYQRVPLDNRFRDSEPMVAMMAGYQEQLKALGLSGLQLRPIPHQSGHQFVGSAKCGECHTDEYDVWQETPHAHATDTLVNVNPPRQFDPECLSCHVTGWEAQEYMPLATGYLNMAESAHLVGNGCENCHGPGSAHVAAEQALANGEVADQQQADLLRSEMQLSLEDARKNSCVRCHDLDNSVDFDFDIYWPDVEH